MIDRKIIVQNVTNLTDARYFAAWGVEYLSYNLKSDSPYVLPLEQIIEIKNWVEGPKTLIESASVEYLEGIDGHILDEAFSSLPINKEAFFRTTLENFSNGLPGGNYIIKVNGENIKTISALTPDQLLGHNLYLDITELDFDLLDQLPDHGLIIQGGEEEKVGVKSFDELDKLYDWLMD